MMKEKVQQWIAAATTQKAEMFGFVREHNSDEWNVILKMGMFWENRPIGHFSNLTFDDVLAEFKSLGYASGIHVVEAEEMNGKVFERWSFKTSYESVGFRTLKQKGH